MGTTRVSRNGKVVPTTYLFSISGPLTLIKLSPHSPATALASSVLPQPGNPYNNRPERSRSGHLEKIGAYRVGYCSVSSKVCRVECNPPIEEKVVELCCKVTLRSDDGVKPLSAASKSAGRRVIVFSACYRSIFEVLRIIASERARDASSSRSPGMNPSVWPATSRKSTEGSTEKPGALIADEEFRSGS